MTGEQRAGDQFEDAQGGMSGQRILSNSFDDLPGARRQPVREAGGQQKGKKGSKGGTAVGSAAKQPKLRDIFVKCPGLAERFSVFSQPRPPEGGPHELG